MLFFCRSIHTPEQTISPALQLALHDPALHTVPVEQTFPHALQFCGSLERSTHLPLHLPMPVGHKHAPEMQEVPPVHANSHAPQCLEFDCTSTHEPPQFVKPVPHADEQPPDEHTSFVLQTFPQFPQFCGSLASAAHVSPWQMVSLTGHAHAPPTHERSPGHALPHVPQ